MVGTGFRFTGGMVSDRAWKSKSIQLDEVDVDTGDASYALRDLALIDATGEGEGGDARLARLGTLELGRGGGRVVVEDLSAHSPAWREGMGGAQAIEAVSMTVDTVDRHRWQSSGWRLIGVATATSGRASADTASLENLVLDVADDSTVGAQRIELDGLIFDGESTVHAASAFAERTYFRASDGSGVDVPGLRADTVEWNGETLAAERGAAPLMNVVATPVRAAFDTVAFTSARLGAGGIRQLGAATSASGRGEVEHVLEWSAGGLALGGYHVPAPDESMLDFAEAVTSRSSATPMERAFGPIAWRRGERASMHRAKRCSRTRRWTASRWTIRAVARARRRARLRASPLTIRESGLDHRGTESLRHRKRDRTEREWRLGASGAANRSRRSPVLVQGPDPGGEHRGLGLGHPCRRPDNGAGLRGQHRRHERYVAWARPRSDRRAGPLLRRSGRGRLHRLAGPAACWSRR